MQWETKGKDNEKITGYYMVDSVPTNDPDEENMISVRFLGNNTTPLVEPGMQFTYSGADFFDYLHTCCERGTISFGRGDEFMARTEENKNNNTFPRFHSLIETQEQLRKRFPDVKTVNLEDMNAQIDTMLNSGNEKKEAKTSAERELHPGMIFAMQDSK